MGKYLDIARKFEAERTGKRADAPACQQQSPSPADYRALYRQTAEAIAQDCWALDPAWLLAHPAFYERIRALDDRLTEMERAGTTEQEYGATLAQLVKCVQDARALC